MKKRTYQTKRSVRFRPCLASFETPAVWIDIAKFDQAWAADDLYVGPFGKPDNQPGKYARVGEWIEMGGELEMPHMGIGDDDGIPGFSDGRHRFAWLRDHGAEAMPVTVDAEEQQEIKRRFGTRRRTCKFVADLAKA